LWGLDLFIIVIVVVAVSPRPSLSLVVGESAAIVRIVPLPAEVAASLATSVASVGRRSVIGIIIVTPLLLLPRSPASTSRVLIIVLFVGRRVVCHSSWSATALPRLLILAACAVAAAAAAEPASSHTAAPGTRLLALA
jgi:hypothetical protein